MAAAGALALAAGSAGAQVFSGGLPSAYTCTGTCGTTGASGSIGLNPGGGTQFGYISTVNAPDADPLGVAGTTNGSVLRSATFTPAAGQTLSFFFNYVTSDGAGYSDYAFVRLLNTAAPGSPLTLFTARTTTSGNTVPGFELPGFAPGLVLTPASTPIIGGESNPPTFVGLGDDSGQCYDVGCGYTGWIGARYMVQQAGSYQLEFGVFNFDDRAYESALAFDFAVGAGDTPGEPVGPGPVDPGPIDPGPTDPVQGVVPEPSTYALLGMGLAGIAGMARRRRAA